MKLFLVAIFVLLVLHLLIALYVWRKSRGQPGRNMALGVMIRFLIVPVVIVVALVVAALWVPEPEETIDWMLIAALVAYLAYLAISAVVFGVRVIRERSREGF